jgi:flavin-binding protein dodecin
MKGVEKLTIVKIIELIGSSPNSWSEAAQNAVTEAAKTIKGIKGVHVKRCTAKVTDDKILEYNVNVKISFIVKR